MARHPHQLSAGSRDANFLVVSMALIRLAKNFFMRPSQVKIVSNSPLITSLNSFTSQPGHNSVLVPLRKSNLFAVVASLTPFRNSFHTSATVFIPQNLRKQKARNKASLKDSNAGLKQIVAYCSAESYNLTMIRYAFGTKMKEFNLPEIEDAMAYSYKNGQIYVFAQGVIVFWDIEPTDQLQFINKLTKFAASPFKVKFYPAQPAVTIDDISNELEADTLSYSVSANESVASRINRKGLITLSSPTASLDQYAFSNALALSVKLATWETSLDSFAESIKSIAYAMREGQRIKIKRKEVFQKVGELFSLRSNINLGSDLLDSPDFYWDREDLETLFQNTCSFLSLRPRTNLMNEKLTYCYELLQQLTSHMDQDHNSKLEWMIIILIAVEVLFEIVHFMDKYY